MERFIKYVAIILAVAVVKAYFGETDGGDRVVHQKPRTPTIYNMPATISVAKPLPKLELPEIAIPKLSEMPRVPKMPQMSELPKLEPPTPVDIDSLKAEIEATQFRLPELNLTKLSE